MIITQTRERRTFVGSLNRGAETIASILNMCVDNTIFCALFRGTGYLQDPTLRTFNPAKKTFNPPTKHEGAFHLVTMQGNVSLSGTDTSVRAHVMGTLLAADGSSSQISGELVDGPVLTLEFIMSTVDDIKLYRAKDEMTGLDPWLHMDLGKGLPRAPDTRQPLPAISRTTPPAVETELSEEPERENPTVNIGDWLRHPTLGTCKVVQGDHDDRVAIELASGRVVELHLDLLALTPTSRGEDGNPGYQVNIKRRRR
jgi:predicted DNA-binding protein with PD1-like motif